MINKTTVSGGQKPYSAPALEKGLDILELLAKEQAAMSAPQISSALNRSKSEIYRMLTVLESRGYLARDDGSDDFRITNRLFDLGMSVSPIGTLVESAYPVMHELSERIRQSCHLVVASGEHMVIVARVESSAVFGFSVKVGRHASLFETTSGIVLLAFMPSAEREELFLAHGRQSRGFDRSAFMAKLEAMQKRGWLQQESIDVPGITDICVPVFQGGTDQAIACLMVPYLKTSRTKMPLVESRKLIGEAANEISSLAATHQGF